MGTAVCGALAKKVDHHWSDGDVEMAFNKQALTPIAEAAQRLYGDDVHKDIIKYAKSLEAAQLTQVLKTDKEAEEKPEAKSA